MFQRLKLKNVLTTVSAPKLLFLSEKNFGRFLTEKIYFESQILALFDELSFIVSFIHKIQQFSLLYILNFGQSHH